MRALPRLWKPVLAGVLAVGSLSLAGPSAADPPPVLEDATVTTPVLGGPHAAGVGYAGESMCPAGTVLTGIRGETRVVAISITVAVARAVCADALDLGGAPVLAPAMGDPGGGVAGQTECPAGQAVVGVVGRQGDFIDQVAVRCLPPAGGGAPIAAAPFGGALGTAAGPFDCPDGRPAIGFRGEVIDWNPDHVRNLALVCVAAPPDDGDDDVTAPTVGSTTNPDPNAAGWHRADATVVIWAVDPDGSGVDRIEWSVNGGPTGSTAGATAAIPVTADGITTITFSAVDAAGNRSATGETTVRVDRTAPTVAVALAPAPSASGWHTTALTITLTPADGGSGVARTDWTTTRGASGSGGSGPVSVVVTDEGTTTLSASVTDVAGNRADAAPVTVSVDRRAPSLRLPMFTVASPGAPVRYRYEVSDTVDPAPVVTCNPTSVPTGSLLAPGGCRATDAAGNSTVAATLLVRLGAGAHGQLCGVFSFLADVGAVAWFGPVIDRMLIIIGSTLGCRGYPEIPPPLPIVGREACGRALGLVDLVSGSDRSGVLQLLLRTALVNLCRPA